MADIFFSYSRSDLDRVRPLVEALEERGWSVWWDPDIHGGESWSDVIEAELKQARCVIVAWSARSAESEWVREEARVANQSRKLVPLLLDRMDPPFGFGGLQTLDLSGWAAGQYQAAEFQRLCRSIQTKLVANAVPGLSAPLDAKVSTPAAEKQDRAPEKQDSPTIPSSPSRRQRAHSRTEMVLIVLGVTSLTGIGWYWSSKMSDRSIDKPSAGSTSSLVAPPPAPVAPIASNGYTVYLHTKRPQPQIDTLTQRLKQAGYDIANLDKDADNDSGRASPRSGVDYATADAAKNRDAADKAARIANELLGTEIKPRPQSAMAAGKLGIWLPYTGDYNVTIHFAGDFARKGDIIPLAQKLRSAGWRVQEPTAGGGERDEAAAKLCEVRYRASDDRAFAELLAAEVPKTGIAPGRANVKEPDSKVGAGELQLWIGSGICK